MEVKSHIRDHLEWIVMGSDVVFHAESKKQTCKTFLTGVNNKAKF